MELWDVPSSIISFIFFLLFFKGLYFYPTAKTPFSYRIGQYTIFPPLRQETTFLKISEKSQPHEQWEAWLQKTLCL